MKQFIRNFIVLLPLWALSGCFLHSDLVEAPPHTAKAEQCKECHLNEYQEWEKSRHAQAYRSVHFQRQTDNYAVKKCLVCHATAPIYGSKKLSVRQNNITEGVTCVTCHLTPDQELAGPLFILPAHASKTEDPFYRDSKLCGTCHKEHLKEWEGVQQLNPKKELKTCQQCHMPRAERKLIPQGIFQYLHWEQKVGRHTFNLDVKPFDDQDWVRISSKFMEQKERFIVDLVISHQIPHSLPSGIFGFKAIDLIVALKNPSGKTLEEKIVTFYVEEKRNILPGKRVKKRFVFSASARAEAEYVEFQVNRRTSRTDFGRRIFTQRNRI